MRHLQDAIEQTRLGLSKTTAAEKKSRLGQFLTPAPTARFMADLFVPGAHAAARLLDAGAGIGSLSAAFMARQRALELQSLSVDAFETDDTLHAELLAVLQNAGTGPAVSVCLRGGDFVEQAVNRIQLGGAAEYTHAILNPPYKKIPGSSRHRSLLRQVGIETVNLYSAFMALALHLLTPGGQLVAIVPRSFCNGPYYRSFREFVLARVHQHPMDRIVFPADTQRFIHVPTSMAATALEGARSVSCSLTDIGVHVSTGPVVDFRMRQHLRSASEADTVPLLYPAHFANDAVQWPKIDSKKPDFMVVQDHEVRLL